jgi:hypothetical protein
MVKYPDEHYITGMYKRKLTEGYLTGSGGLNNG